MACLCLPRVNFLSSGRVTTETRAEEECGHWTLDTDGSNDSNGWTLPCPPTALITLYSAHLGLHRGGHGADGGPELEVRPEEARAAAQLLLAGGRQAAQGGVSC